MRPPIWNLARGVPKAAPSSRPLISESPLRKIWIYGNTTETPSSTVSGIPPERPATEGSQAAAASRNFAPNPSDGPRSSPLRPCRRQEGGLEERLTKLRTTFRGISRGFFAQLEGFWRPVGLYPRAGVCWFDLSCRHDRSRLSRSRSRSSR